MTGSHTPTGTKSAMEDTVPADVGEVPKPTVSAELLVRGTGVGRYTVLERIGAGGMGVVYAAFDPELDRRIALKVLHPGGSGSIGTTDGRNRLLREAQAMAKLHHPNVITVHDVGTLGDRVFVAMEFVDGSTLREWLRQGVREWPEIIEVFVRAGRGLAAAHAVGLVHRDFKPDNVLVGNDGRVLVMDFGLARQAGPPSVVEGSSSNRLVPLTSAPDTVLTRTGAVLGTPAYMAPEQHAGGAIGAAVDQFSFCVALYEALYGDRPFAGNSVASLAIAVLEGKPRLPPRDSGVPSWLFGVISRGLSVEPNDRFPSMDVLLAELQRDPPKTGRPALAVAVALGVAATIVGGYLWSRPDPTASCRAELDGIAPILDDTTVATLGTAFGTGELDYAAASLDSTMRELTALDGRWRASWLTVCEASRARPGVAPEYAGPRACLVDQRAAAVALLDRLAQAGPWEIQRAVAASQSLDAPERCAGAGPLAAEQGSRAAGGRSGPELRASLLAARTDLRLERWAEAADRVVGLTTPNVEFDDATDAAETLLVFGIAEARRGHAAAAHASLRRALLAAAATGSTRLEREAWLALLEVTARGATGRDDGWSTVVGTEAALERAGDDAIARARWLRAHGHLQLASGHYRDALDRYERADSALREAVGADDLRLSELALERGMAAAANEAHADAMAACATALEHGERVLGTAHPGLADALAGLAIGQLALDNDQAARASLQRAHLLLDLDGEIAIDGMPMPGALPPQWGSQEIPRHADLLAVVLDRSGLADRAARRFDRAARWHARAAALLERARDPEDRALGYPLLNLGVALGELGRPGEAVPHLRRVLDIWQAQLPADHPDLPLAHIDLANALVGTRELAEAGTHYQRALELWEDRLPADHPRMAFALTGIGRVRLGLGDIAGAIEPLERALELRSHAREDELNVAETSWLLARALWMGAQDEPRVLELATRALGAARSVALDDPLELRRLLGGGVAEVEARLSPAWLTAIDYASASRN